MVSTVLLTALMAAGPAAAWPGMVASGDSAVHARHHHGDISRDIKEEALKKRQQFGGSTILLGDLATLPDSELTDVGVLAKGVLQTTLPPLGNSDGSYVAPGPLGSYKCEADTCCVWKFIEEELSAAFRNPDGQCSDAARGAVRLGFHDAGTWESTLDFGGADGSILLNPVELARSENNGLQDHVAQFAGWYAKYKDYGVTAADLIQFGAILATVVCPLGPQMFFLAGRPDSTELPPTGLLPLPSQDAPELIELFEAKTFNADDLVALLGAHSTSAQDFVDPTQAGAPQDSTEGIWDVLFYNETLLEEVPEGVFRFHSDFSVATDPATSAAWAFFAQPDNQGQDIWNLAFAQAYFRMSLLGIKHINNMTDCTKVLPAPVTSFPGVPPNNGPSSSSTYEAPTSTYYPPTSVPTYSDLPTSTYEPGTDYPTYTTTVCTTTTYTVTDCPDTVTYCPAEYPGYETTETLTYTTTWCPGKGEEGPTGAVYPTGEAAPLYPTVYATGALAPSPSKPAGVVTAGAAGFRASLALAAAAAGLSMLL